MSNLSKYKNIEEYRSKQKRKGFLKKALIFLFIIAILIVLLNVLEVFKGKKINELIGKDNTSEMNSYPLTIKNEQLLSVSNISSNIAILTKTNVLMYSDNGKLLQKVTHGYTNPVVREGVKKILTYDRGGKSFRVDTSTGTVGEEKIDGQILYAQISKTGNIAVISTHDRYACVVTVYNSSLEEIYHYFSTEHLSQVAFSSDNHHIITSSISTQNGILSTNLYELDINEDTKATSYNINDIIPLDISYSIDGYVTVVGKENIVTLNTKTKAQNRYDYSGKILFFENSSDNETILVTSNTLNNFATINIINEKGELKHSLSIDEDILDLYSDGSRIILLTKKYAYNFSMTLSQLNKIELSKNYNRVLYNGESLYIMGTDIIEKFKVD